MPLFASDSKLIDDLYRKYFYDANSYGHFVFDKRVFTLLAYGRYDDSTFLKSTIKMLDWLENLRRN